MPVTVSRVLDLLNQIAPLELAEEWDNVGLLAGDPDQEVDTVLCALDLNRQVLDEAAFLGAQLIVTHHPILFRGRKNLCEADAEGNPMSHNEAMTGMVTGVTIVEGAPNIVVEKDGEKHIVDISKIGHVYEPTTEVVE